MASKKSNENVTSETITKADVGRLSVGELREDLPAIPEGFENFGTDRLLYKPELCGTRRLRGFLIDAVKMGEDKPVDDQWVALVFRLTEPTLGVAGKEGEEEKVVEVAVGEEILIPVTEKLEKLIPYAKHPTQMAEFIVDVIGKIKLDPAGKKTMWRYRVVGAPPVDRESVSPWQFAQQVNEKLENGGKGAAALPG